MENLQVPLTLTVGEINVLMKGLSELAYKDAVTLINKLMEAGTAVIKASQEPEVNPGAPPADVAVAEAA